MKRQALYIDCFAGIAGDMMLGALIDLGVPESVIRDGLALLPVSDFELQTSRAARHGIVGCDVKVIEHQSPTGHAHSSDAHSHSPSRQWKDISQMLQDTELPIGAKRLAFAIFERLAVAEASLHGVTPEEVHFHEVGGVDAIVDIVGTAIAIDWLKPDTILSSPVPVPRGFVQCQHGRMPLPAPATLEILRGAEIIGVDDTGEWVTPTGAAIISTLADSFQPVPAMIPSAIGYGVGDRDTPTHANLLRLILGSQRPSPIQRDTITQLEATMDDMLPEWYGALSDRLRDNKALDYWLTPVQMKKGRPGTQVTVLCHTGDADRFTQLLFRESTTLGIRIQQVERAIAERMSVQVETPYGVVRVKVATLADETINIAPEYDDCLAISVEQDLPIKDVYAEVLNLFKQRRETSSSAP
ncbi:MAG: nickel pincer cofactor biosynthesis protein LarC [Myxococcota bacterium]|nr:nickel pincer cofactor biosynthesis protein LarC [Myxococcota bacterium]